MSKLPATETDLNDAFQSAIEIDLNAAFQSAIAHHQAGRLSQAETLYRMVLQVMPTHPDANHNLGVIAMQLGQLDQALPLLHTALVNHLGHGRFWLSYIDALLRANRPDEARQWLEQGQRGGLAGPEVEALAQRLANSQKSVIPKPGKGQPSLEAQKSLVALFNQGQAQACEQAARQMTEQYPRHLLGWKTLGAALIQLGRNVEGVQAMRQAAQLAPKDVEVLSNLGVALTQMAQYEEAEHSYRRALKLQPKSANLHAYLADALFLQSRFADAIRHARQAIALDNNHIVAYHNLGVALRSHSQLMDAETALRRALDLAWNYPSAHANLANVLKDQAHLEEAEKHLRIALEMTPHNRLIRSNLLFTGVYNHAITPEQLYADHCEQGRLIAQAAGPRLPLRRKLPDAPQRVGFVSADFFHHAVSYFVEPVWQGLREQGLCVLAYYTGKTYDVVSARLQKQCDVWREVAMLTDDELAQQIADDDVDILIDLSGHTGGGRLPVFARQPAPVQATWLGHPATTGLPGMHWRITDMHAEPPGMTEHLNSERLYRMPDVFCCYRPSASPDPYPGLPADDSGRFTFGCFNNFAKVTPPVIACWGEILRQSPQARLLLEVHGAQDEAFVQDIRQRFVATGARAEQIDILPRQNNQQYVLYRQVDLALDPFPCCGGTTSCDSLWMGTPFVSLAGRTFVSRMGVTLLHSVGLDELIADNEAQYIATAVALANDLPRLRALRKGLRERVAASPLMNAPRFALHFGQALQALWAQREER